MSESAHVIVVPGAGTIQSNFAGHGIRFSPDDKSMTPSFYRERRAELQCVTKLLSRILPCLA
jgi:hypothetical protein